MKGRVFDRWLQNEKRLVYNIYNIYMHSWLYMIIQCIVYTGAQIGFWKGSPSELFLADSKRSCSESGSKISKKTFPGSPKHTQYTNPKSIKNAPTLKANGLKHWILLNTLKIHIVILTFLSKRNICIRKRCDNSGELHGEGPETTRPWKTFPCLQRMSDSTSPEW